MILKVIDRLKKLVLLLRQISIGCLSVVDGSLGDHDLFPEIFGGRTAPKNQVQEVQQPYLDL